MSGTLAYVLAAMGCLVGVAGLVVAAVAWNRTRSRPQRRAKGPGDPLRDRDADALRGDPRRLKPGDIVEIRGVSYAVRGSIRLVEGGWSWAEHLLDDAGGVRRWLSVEEDPELELVLWEPSRAPPSPPAPRPSTSPAAVTTGTSPARPASPPSATPGST